MRTIDIFHSSFCLCPKAKPTFTIPDFNARADDADVVNIKSTVLVDEFNKNEEAVKSSQLKAATVLRRKNQLAR